MDVPLSAEFCSKVPGVKAGGASVKVNGGIVSDNKQEIQKVGESELANAGEMAIAAPPQASHTNTSTSLGVVSAIALFVSIITSGGMLVAYDHWVAPQIVSVDIKGYIANQRDLYVAGKINDAQFKANVDRMAAVIEGLPKNKIVVMGDAVVRGVEKVELGGETVTDNSDKD